jgi:hypothetical protein
MKRLLIAPLVLLLLIGCGPTAAQLAAEKDYYTAFTANKQQSTPLFEILAQDPAKPMIFDNVARITVYTPPPSNGPVLQQYQHRDYAAPWIGLIGNVLSVAVPWVALGYIANSFKDMTHSTSYNQNITGTNNTGSIRTSGNMGMGNLTGNGNQTGGIFDNTSVPTVVTQPTPIIVEQPAPVIVQPSYPPK